MYHSVQWDGLNFIDILQWFREVLSFFFFFFLRVPLVTYGSPYHSGFVGRDIIFGACLRVYLARYACLQRIRGRRLFSVLFI